MIGGLGSAGVTYLLMVIESLRFFWEGARLRGLLSGGGLSRLSIKLEMEFTYLLPLLDFISLFMAMSFIEY
jgi:hypothetical protein